MTDRAAYIAPAMLAAGAACLAIAAWCKPANGAERRQWEIVLTEKPTAAEPDRVRTFVISEAYPSKDECLITLTRIRIKAAGARVRCLPKED